MKERTQRKRTCGFQFSWGDALTVGAFLVAAFALARMDSPLWWMLVIAAVHFFLFCNVFRIIRRRELVWAGLFILNVGIWLWIDELTWPRVLLCQLPITILLIIADMRTPWYHGVFANRVNSKLNDYLAGNDENSP